MKQIKFLLAILTLFILLFSNDVGAQVFMARATPATNTVARGGINAGGTYQAIGYTTGTTFTIVQGTVTAISSTHPDTLKAPVVNALGYNTDTGYVFFSFSSVVNRQYDLKINRLTGTLAGRGYLQGSNDGQFWYNITGDTSTCSGCVGAFATISGTGTTDYQWQVPKEKDLYVYHQVVPILSGTCTATFSAQQITGY